MNNREIAIQIDGFMKDWQLSLPGEEGYDLDGRIYRLLEAGGKGEFYLSIRKTAKMAFWHPLRIDVLEKTLTLQLTEPKKVIEVECCERKI